MTLLVPVHRNRGILTSLIFPIIILLIHFAANYREADETDGVYEESFWHVR